MLNINYFFSQTIVDFEQKIVASNRSASVRGFGSTVSIYGNYAVSSITTGAAVYVYKYDGSTWNEVDILTPVGGSGNSFGSDLFINDEFIMIGDYQNSLDENGLNSVTDAGAIYVFKKDDNLDSWTEVQKVVGPSRVSFERLGRSIDLVGDYLISEQHNHPSFSVGRVVIYKRDDGADTWSFLQELAGTPPVFNYDEFGKDVAFDGTYLVIGTPGDREDVNELNYINQAGSVYIYKLDTLTETFNQVDKLIASDRNLSDNFGFDVAIAGDFIAVSAINQDEDENGNNTLNASGMVYIFEKDGSNDSWTEIQRIVPSDRDADDGFGADLVMTEDHIVVGVSLEDEDEEGNNSLASAGSVYIFEKEKNSSNWVEVQKIVAPVRAADDRFGVRVQIDMRNLIVGAYLEDEDENETNTIGSSGSIYYFKIRSTPCISSFSVKTEGNLSALFSALIDDEGESTTITFKYGTSSGIYTNETDPQVSNGNDIRTTFQSQVSGLIENQTYFVIAEATSSNGTTQSSEISFTAIKSSDDIDGDGVLNTIEVSAPNSGDGNGDGTSDSEQTNVTSLIVNNEYVTIEVLGGCDIINAAKEVLDYITNEFSYHLGQLEFKLPCSNAEVKLYFHGIETLDGYTYRKLFPDNTYKELENVTFSSETIGGNQVAVATLTLTDGGPGDYDGLVNGIIYDPGGPALPVSANIPYWSWWWILISIPFIILIYKTTK